MAFALCAIRLEKLAPVESGVQIESHIFAELIIEYNLSGKLEGEERSHDAREEAEDFFFWSMVGPACKTVILRVCSAAQWWSAKTMFLNRRDASRYQDLETL
jgi:hypothetical protein